MAGKGSHRKLVHGRLRTLTAIIPGKDGDDARPYLEKQVAELLRRAKLAGESEPPAP